MSELAPGKTLELGTRVEGGPSIRRDKNCTDGFAIDGHGGELYRDEIKQFAEAAGYYVSEEGMCFSAQEFGALLTLVMVSDPWPASERNHRRIRALINEEARARNYNDWIHAYHELCGEFDE